MKKLWGTRFSESTDADVEEFTSSLGVDQRLVFADLKVSMAHARMLGASSIIPLSDAEQIVKGLEKIGHDMEAGRLTIDPSEEDIHSQIEKWLYAAIGDAAGKLHTARSRNDQVVTSFRLFLKGDLQILLSQVTELQNTILKLAEDHTETIMPGLTHTQHAQPVSLAHHLMAYGWMLQRDKGRLQDALKRVDEMPLGCGALAGTSFNLNREMVAKELGFSKISENSLDAVSDRDFVVEILNACALIMSHYSKLCEELIWWSAPEFGFVTLSDRVTTGSSMMPQKKNPDVAELIRGRVGIVYGQLMGALTMLKGLPLSYNRDLQEDKPLLFSALDHVHGATLMMKKQLATARFHNEKMAQSLAGDFSNATDLADFLVGKGLPFREAHEVTGKVVKYALDKGLALEQLSLAHLQQFSSQFDKKVLDMLSHEAVFRARKTRGGTAPEAVRVQIAKLKELVKS